MKTRILILTELGDIHAYAVAEALRRKGAEAVLWHTSDFPSCSGETILFEGGQRTVTVRGPAMELEDDRFSTVWHRRPTHALDEGLLHPADRRFADIECSVFRRSLFNLIAPEAFWVNPPDAVTRAGRKPLQHQIASEIGFVTPATAYTNYPEQIRSFLARHRQIVYKTFHGAAWRDDETCWAVYTSLLTEERLVEDDILRSVPGIYQELVEKAHELRVTVMGDRIFPAKLDSQRTRSGRLDWRRSYRELQMEACDLPPVIAERCRAILNRLGLVFACIDLIVTPAGEYVFLELNEMGQFLFVERYTGLPLLDAFAEFLVQGCPRFAWEPGRVQVRYADIAELVLRHEAELAGRHAPSPDRSIRECGEAEPSNRCRPP